MFPGRRGQTSRRKPPPGLERLESRWLPSFSSVAGATVPATEGAGFSATVATFSSPDSGPFTATIDWGDSSSSSGSVSGSGGNFSVTGSHNYADEGSFPVAVALSDSADGATASATGTAEVGEADVLEGTAVAYTRPEGVNYPGPVATFTDSNLATTASDFTASVDWGGVGVLVTPGFVTGANGSFTVGVNFTATDEGAGYSIVVSVREKAPGTATMTVVNKGIVITEADVLSGAAAPVSATAGVAFSGAVATFSDTFPANVRTDFNHTSIDWGDGSTDVGTVSGGGATFTVSGSHTYADEGSFPITVVFRDNDGGGATATVMGTASVTAASVAAPDVLAVTGASVSATEGAAFTGPVASFSDSVPRTAGDFTASIDWGDGSTDSGTVSGSSGTFTVSGSHLYAQEGTFPVTVTVAEGPAEASATGVASVVAAETLPANAPSTAPATVPSTIPSTVPSTTPATVPSTMGGSDTSSSPPPPLLLTGQGVPVTGFEFTSTSAVVATFSAGDGSEPAGNFKATISWGDGGASVGLVTESGGSYTVSGSHTYTDEGSFSISVALSDGPAVLTIGTVAVMQEELLPDGTRGDSNQRFVSEVYRDLLGRQVDPVGLGDLGGGLDGGTLSRQQVAQAVASSSEFFTDQVEGLYQLYLGRAADPGGLNNAVTALANGTTLEEVAASLIGSAEFVQRNGGTTQGALNGLYELALHRGIDPMGLANASAALAGGAALSDVALGVLGSVEYRSDLVNGYYLQLLGRQADSAGLGNALAALAAGATDQQIIAGLVSADEFFARTA
jgi:hypothetical protein